MPLLAYFLFYLYISVKRLWLAGNDKDRYRVKIVFYSSIREDPGMGIGARLRALVPAERVEVYQSIEDLVHGLHRLYDHDTIVLLQARDREELLHIASLRDLLQGLRVILLVPDREEETISLAHRLRPRFLSNSENDFSDIMNVLRKMLGYSE
jgi:hypothetical protein